MDEHKETVDVKFQIVVSDDDGELFTATLANQSKYLDVLTILQQAFAGEYDLEVVELETVKRHQDIEYVKSVLRTVKELEE